MSDSARLLEEARKLLSFYVDDEGQLRPGRIYYGGEGSLARLAFEQAAELQRLREALERVCSLDLPHYIPGDYVRGFDEDGPHAPDCPACRLATALAGSTATRKEETCNHHWRYFPTLDMNPAHYSRQCELCGSHESQTGPTHLGQGRTLPGTDWSASPGMKEDTDE